jgi:hypothetical protein
MTFKKHEWKRRIRHEFDEPAKMVIISFAKQGYSKLLTAGAIGITAQTLRNYANREKIKFPDRDELREECKPKPRKLGIVRNPWGRRGKASIENEWRVKQTVTGKAHQLHIPPCTKEFIKHWVRLIIAKSADEKTKELFIIGLI